MNIWEFSLLVWIGSFTAGLIGALTGLGGGVVITWGDPNTVRISSCNEGEGDEEDEEDEGDEDVK